MPTACPAPNPIASASGEAIFRADTEASVGRSLRSALHRLIQPRVFDFWARHLNPSWSLTRPLARVVRIERASSRAVSLLLKPNRHWPGARAGQHVNLGVEVDGRRLTRSYSLSAPPRADGCIEVTVNAVEGGRVSPHLAQHARHGEMFEIGPGFGELGLAPAGQAPHLLLAAGSGITPLMALIREQAARGGSTPITLAYWAKRSEELCFADELRKLASTHAWLRVEFLLTAEGNAPASRIDAAQLQRLAPMLEAHHVLACGPGGFVETARALSAGALSFQGEGFSPAPINVVESGVARVHLQRSGRTLDLPRDRSLLDALEQQGVFPKHGCRMGVCHTCRCTRVEGASRDLANGETSSEPASPIRLCVSAAAGDLTLDL